MWTLRATLTLWRWEDEASEAVPRHKVRKESSQWKAAGVRRVSCHLRNYKHKCWFCSKSSRSWANPPACRRVLWILLCFGLASALALKESPLTRFSTDSPPPPSPPLPSPPLPLVRPLRPLRPLCPTLHPLHPLLRPLPFPPFLLLLHFLLFQFSAPCIGEP